LEERFRTRRKFSDGLIFWEEAIVSHLPWRQWFS